MAKNGMDGRLQMSWSGSHLLDAYKKNIDDDEEEEVRDINGEVEVINSSACW